MEILTAHEDVQDSVELCCQVICISVDREILQALDMVLGELCQSLDKDMADLDSFEQRSQLHSTARR